MIAKIIGKKGAMTVDLGTREDRKGSMREYAL